MISRNKYFIHFSLFIYLFIFNSLVRARLQNNRQKLHSSPLRKSLVKCNSEQRWTASFSCITMYKNPRRHVQRLVHVTQATDFNVYSVILTLTNFVSQPRFRTGLILNFKVLTLRVMHNSQEVSLTVFKVPISHDEWCIQWEWIIRLWFIT